MKLRTRLAAAAALTLAFASPMAFADPTAAPIAAPNPTEAPRVARKVVDPNVDAQAVICKREDSTGTRLGATKVCHTRSEWAARSEASRQNTQRFQNGVIYH